MSLRKQGECSQCGEPLYGDDCGAAGHKCAAMTDQKKLPGRVMWLSREVYTVPGGKSWIYGEGNILANGTDPVHILTPEEYREALLQAFTAGEGNIDNSGLTIYEREFELFCKERGL